MIGEKGHAVLPGGNISLHEKKPIDISVVVPIVERYDDLEKLFSSYAREIEKIVDRYEFIFIVDGHMSSAYKEIKKFSSKYPQIKVIRFSRPLGEAVALSEAFDRARGKYIFTIASYFQVEPSEVGRIHDALISNDCDIVVTRRKRECDSIFNKIQAFVFHKIIKILTGAKFQDLSCGLRGINREVIGVFQIYGDLHRFIPVLAEHHGLRVLELSVNQRKEDTKTRIYKISTYLKRFIDVITVFFILRFTYKPLRLFGMIGSLLIMCGGVITLYLIYQRLTNIEYTLADKPSLFLASLLIVIGIQVFAIGLIGEIIIYTHSKKTKRFNVKEIVD